MKKIAISLFFQLFLVCGFSQTQVSYDKSEGIDFSKYKTYKIDSLNIKNIPEFVPKKSGLDMLILEISKQLNLRGYNAVSENPDLLINIGVAITSEVQTRDTHINEAPLYTGQRNYQWESQEVVVRNYTEGTVTVDVIDASKEEMIWQAVSSRTLSKKREKNKKKIDKAVIKMFKKYPISIMKN